MKNEFDKMIEMGFTTEEAQQALDVEMRVVEHNTFPRDKIVTTALVKNGTEMGSVHLVNDLKRGGSFRVSKKYLVKTHEDLTRLVVACRNELDLDLEHVMDARHSGLGNDHNGQLSGMGMRAEDGMSVSRDGRFMATSYVVKNGHGFEVGNGDKMEAGITLVNSIDGSTALNIVPMTFRLLCKNQMHHMLTGVRNFGGTYTSKLAKRLRDVATVAWTAQPILQDRYKTVAEFIDIAMRTKFRHTTKWTEEELASSIALKLQMVTEFQADYQRLAETNLTEKFVQRLIGISSPPSSALSVSDTLEVVKEGNCGFTVQRKNHQFEDLAIDKNMTQWDCFNAYTDLWGHRPNARTTIMSHLNRYRKAHLLFNFGSASDASEQEVITVQQ